MIGVLALLGLAVLIVACGPSSPVATQSPSPPVLAGQTPATPGPTAPEAASAARSKPPQYAACTSPSPNGVEVLSLVFAQDSVETVHLLTVDGSVITDCVLFDRQPIEVWDAVKGVVLLSTDDGTLWTLDLRTSSLHNVGYSRGDLVGPILSPDATEAVFEVGDPLVESAINIIDLQTGASRTVLEISHGEYFGTGLVPLRWLQSGILLTGMFGCGYAGGILKLDPSSGGLERIDGVVGVLSPSGARQAYSVETNLSDAPYIGQCGWHDTVFTSAVGGRPAVIQEHANRDFYARDIRDDGEVLFTSDDSPGSTASPAADMGIYLYADGASTKQFGEARVGYWQSAVFVGPDTAIAAEALSSGPYGSVEVIFISLCKTAGCQASAKAIDNPTGPYPVVRLIPVRS